MMAAHRCLYVSIWHVVAVIAATVSSTWGQDDLWSLRPIHQPAQPALRVAVMGGIGPGRGALTSSRWSSRSWGRDFGNLRSTRHWPPP